MAARVRSGFFKSTKLERMPKLTSVTRIRAGMIDRARCVELLLHTRKRTRRTVPGNDMRQRQHLDPGERLHRCGLGWNRFGVIDLATAFGGNRTASQIIMLGSVLVTVRLRLVLRMEMLVWAVVFVMLVIVGIVAVRMRVFMSMMVIMDVAVCMFMLVRMSYTVMRVLVSVLVRMLMFVGVVVFVLAFHPLSLQLQR